jgi:hypothetical protein
MIDPRFISYASTDREHVAQVCYCGVPVPDMTIGPVRKMADPDRVMTAEFLQDRLDRMPAHARLSLIGRFLAARHDDDKISPSALDTDPTGGITWSR